MVQLPNEQQLQGLKAARQPHSLSMYIRFEDTVSLSGPGRIQFKNALQATEAQLHADGVDKRDREAALRLARGLIDKPGLWTPNHGGLVLFANADSLHYYFVPNQAIQPMVYVGGRFITEPLERILQNNRTYYVLALSQKNVQVFRGDRYTIEPLELDNFANNMKESLLLDEPHKERGLHPVAPASVGKGSQVQHEQYEVSKEQKQMLAEFFRNIDRRLKKVFNKQQAPLVVGGVDYLVTIYRKVNTYGGLAGQAIPGSLQAARPDHIRQQAWQIVRHMPTG